ncbi:NADH dehydrogenase [ubiquinone] 1 alpha subcomplex subunit 5-like [Ornithodoros turicata]
MTRVILVPKSVASCINCFAAGKVNMAGVTKVTTGLTGLAVAKNPHHSLSVLYNKILRVLQNMPETAAYRKYTEQVAKERLTLVESEKDVAKLERMIGAGQIEQVIVQAENELVLARRMMSWKPWEPLTTKAPADQWTWPPAS